MLRVLTFTDLHIDPRDINGKMVGGSNTRMQDKFKILKRIVDIAIEQDVKLVINAGDTFQHSQVPNIFIARYFKIMSKLLEHGIPYYTLLGNHECTNFDNIFSPVIALQKNLQKVKVVSKPILLDFPGDGKDESFRLLLYPYIRNEDCGWSDVVDLLKDKKHPLMAVCHAQLTGVPLYSYQTTLGASISPNILKKNYPNTYWFFGHYHAPQKFGRTGKVQTIGACARNGYSDKDMQPSVHINDLLSTGEIKRKIIPIKDRRLIELVNEEIHPDNWEIRDIVKAIIRGDRVFVNSFELNIPNSKKPFNVRILTDIISQNKIPVKSKDKKDVPVIEDVINTVAQDFESPEFAITIGKDLVDEANENDVY